MNTQLGWTDLEQSKKLVEAGLDQETADMCYDLIEESEWYGFPMSRNLTKDDPVGIFVPCWSLGRLLELMPHFINVDGVECQLNIYPDGVGYWNVDYTDLNDRVIPIDYYDKSLLDSVFYMMCHLLEQGYIKKGE